MVRVYDVGIADGWTYLVMECVDGASLADRLRQRVVVPSWNRVVDTSIQAARGLHAMHRAGLVHCDFKPSNVLVGQDGVVKVADFGLVTAAGRARGPAGTPAYMAPEQRDALAIDHRADQYAFFVSLFEGLRGPGRAGADRQEMLAALNGWSNGRAPARLRRVIARGLSSDPARRFADIAQVIDALEGLRRRRRPFLAAAGLAVVAVGALAWPRPASCPTKELLRGTWDADRRGRALTAVYTGTRIKAALDDALNSYAAAWIDTREFRWRAPAPDCSPR